MRKTLNRSAVFNFKDVYSACKCVACRNKNFCCLSHRLVNEFSVIKRKYQFFAVNDTFMSGDILFYDCFGINIRNHRKKFECVIFF